MRFPRMSSSRTPREVPVATWTAPIVGAAVAFVIGFVIGDAFKVGMTTPGPWSLAPIYLVFVAIAAGILGVLAVIAAITRHAGTGRLLGLSAVALVAGTYLGQALSAGYLGR